MTAPKVLISDKLSEAAVQIFRDRGIDVDFQPDLGKDKDKLAEVIGQYDGLAIRSATKVTEKILENATNLKVIGRAGIGTDNIDKPAASKKGVIVMNTPFGNMITTAEHAIAMMFAVARQIPAANASTQAGKWEKNAFMGTELTGKTLGIIGCGNIGAVVAEGPPVEEEALDTFGMNLGIAFQIIDDVLDYSAKQATLGKTIGDDFREGKISLPVILAFRRGNDDDRDFWRRTLEDLDQAEGDMEHAIHLMEKHSALDDSVERARHYGAIARDALGIFDDSPQKAAFNELIDFCIERAY